MSGNLHSPVTSLKSATRLYIIWLDGRATRRFDHLTCTYDRSIINLFFALKRCYILIIRTVCQNTNDCDQRFNAKVNITNWEYRPQVSHACGRLYLVPPAAVVQGGLFCPHPWLLYDASLPLFVISRVVVHDPQF